VEHGLPSALLERDATAEFTLNLERLQNSNFILRILI